MIECFSVGGNGGSFAQKYWDALLIPKFPSKIQEQIVSLYYSGFDLKNLTQKTNSESFFELETYINKQSGIYELYKTKNMLQSILNKAIQSIIDDEPVLINYNVYSECFTN